MSNAARKARKRSGEKFVKAEKIGTPLEARYVPVVFDRKGRTRGVEVQHLSNRALRKVAGAIMIRDIDREVPVEVQAKRKRALKKDAA